MIHASKQMVNMSLKIKKLKITKFSFKRINAIFLYFKTFFIVHCFNCKISEFSNLIEFYLNVF